MSEPDFDTDPRSSAAAEPPRTRGEVIALATQIHDHYREATRSGDGELGALRRKISLLAALRGRERLAAWSTDRSLSDTVRHGARDALASFSPHEDEASR